MPVIQSVTSVKQEAEEEEHEEKLPIVKLEPGLSKNLKRIESEILAEAAKKEDVRQKKEPELLLDPATGTMRKAGKRKSNDTTLKVPEKTVRKSRPEADTKCITQKVKLKASKRETGTGDEESESERSARKGGTEVDGKYITEKVKLKKGKLDKKRSSSEESEKRAKKSEADTKCITQKVKLKIGKTKVSSEDEEKVSRRNEVESKCVSHKVKLKKGSGVVGKEEEKGKSGKGKEELSAGISERPRRNMVPVKYENFDMKQEPLDDFPQENEASDASDDDEDDFEEAEEMEGSSKDKAYCTCKSAYNKNQPMIGCDGPCQDWYHFGCVGIPQNFRSIADWYCENCFYKLTKGDTQVVELLETDH